MPRRLVLFSTGGLALGVILGQYFSWPIFLPAIAVIGVASVLLKRSVALIIGALVSMVYLGAWRTGETLANYHNAAMAIARLDRPVSGLVNRVWTDRNYAVFELKNIHNEEEVWPGTLRVYQSIIDSTPRAGQAIRIQCRWQPIPAERRNRLASQGLVAECRYPDVVQVLGSSHHWRAELSRIRSRLVQRVMDSYHSPQSDLLIGILLGVQETMTPELRESFRATGTSHIVALSGFNVTIIITVMAATLTSLIGRRLAFWPIIALVVAFVVMTGASASVTRAAVMAMVVQIGSQLGRPVAMSRILAYTFAGMVIVNPLILRYDLGFQLSFMATLGLVYVASPLERRFRLLPEAFSLRGNLSSTLAAILVTEPLLLWTFGRLSIVAPVVNLVVLPFIPLIMATGALGLLLPAAVPLTDALLRLVLAVIATAGAWPIALVSTPWWVAGVVAGGCLYGVFRLVYGDSKKTLADC